MSYLTHQSTVRQVLLSVLSALSLSTSPMVRADDVNAAIPNTAGVNVGAADITFIAVSINTPAPRELVIHYFAECQVQSGYIEYDIWVGNQQVPPTHDNFNALCSAPAAPASVGTTVYWRVPAGNHTIRARGHVENGLGPGLIDDQSLVVEEEAP